MPADLATQITDLARRRYGEEGARVVRAILRTEGALSGEVGDSGQSFGPFQFHAKGMLPAYAQSRGLSLDQAAAKARLDPLDAAQWALDGYLGQAFVAGQKTGLAGPELATYVQQNGQRSQSPERAGQAYQALYGDQAPKGGGGGMPEPGVNPSVPNQRDENLKAIDEYVASLQDEKQQLEASYKAAVDAAAKAEAGKNTTFSAADIAAATATAAEVTRLRSEISNVNAALRAAASARATTARTVVKPTISAATADTTALIDNTIKGMDAEIRAGTRSEQSARNRLDDVMKQASQGANTILSGYDQLRQAAPRLGNAQTVKAIQDSLRGWERLGGTKMPEGDFLPLIPFDPQGAMAPYTPPAPDWRQALAPAAQPQPDMTPYLNVVRGALLPQAGPPVAQLPQLPGQPGADNYWPIPAPPPAAWGQDALDRTRAPMMPTFSPVGPPGMTPGDLLLPPGARQSNNQAVAQALLGGSGPSMPPLPTPTPSPVGPPGMATPGFTPSPELPPMLPGETDQQYWERLTMQVTGQ